IASWTMPRARPMISVACATSSSKVMSFFSAMPCSMAFSATAAASRGKTSQPSMVGIGDLAIPPPARAVVLGRFHVVTVLVKDAVALDEDAARRVCAIGKDHTADSNVGGARTDKSDSHIGDLLAHDLERVDEAGERDAGRALLVVVPDRYLALPAEGIENSETFGLRDVLKVDTTQPGLQQLDDPADVIRVLAVDHERKPVHAAQVPEEQRLAFHHRQASLGANVAQTKHASAVRDDGHRVALVGVLVDLLGVVLDVEARLADARGVPDAEILEIAHAALERRLDLAPVEGVQLHGVFHGLIRLSLELLYGGRAIFVGHAGLLVGRRRAGRRG